MIITSRAFRRLPCGLLLDRPILARHVIFSPTASGPCGFNLDGLTLDLRRPVHMDVAEAGRFFVGTKCTGGRSECGCSPRRRLIRICEMDQRIWEREFGISPGRHLYIYRLVLHLGLGSGRLFGHCWAGEAEAGFAEPLLALVLHNISSHLSNLRR